MLRFSQFLDGNSVDAVQQVVQIIIERILGQWSGFCFIDPQDIGGFREIDFILTVCFSLCDRCR